MATSPDASPFVPAGGSLAVLRQAVQQCRGCDLYRHATQAVFGELEAGAMPAHVHAAMMMIGEQPGDHEDREGHPFVGPAGRLLDTALQQAAIDRKQVYVTNAVKHFKWEPRGKLRIHKKPSLREIRACRPWLDAELAAVRPSLVVCLGATAAQSLLGSAFRVSQSHGEIQHAGGLPPILATLHPSAILRARTHEDRRRNLEIFVDDVDDLRSGAAFLKQKLSS